MLSTSQWSAFYPISELKRKFNIYLISLLLRKVFKFVQNLLYFTTHSLEKLISSLPDFRDILKFGY